MKGSKKERAPGVWSLIYDIGRDEHGRRRQKRVTFHGGERAAQKKLNELLATAQKQGYVEPSRVTLADYLAQWLRDYAQPSLRATTYASYEVMVRRHIVPAIGSIRLDKLQPTHIQRLLADKARGGRADGRPGGLSARSIKYIHSVLSEALSHAVKWGLLGRNPAEVVDPPRIERRQMSTWTPQQASAFLESVRDDRLYALWLLAIMTGMRRGELLGLRWADVDLENGMISVTQTLQRTGDGLVLHEPKTDRSRRSIPIGPTCVAALREHRQKIQAERWWQKEHERGESDLVFVTTRGTPIHPRNLNRTWDSRVHRSGLPPIRLHDLRHTHASVLLANGEHPKVVAERLGHSQVNVTLDIYSHVLPSLQRAAANRAEDLLLPANPPAERSSRRPKIIRGTKVTNR